MAVSQIEQAWDEGPQCTEKSLSQIKSGEDDNVNHM